MYMYTMLYTIVLVVYVFFVRREIFTKCLPKMQLFFVYVLKVRSVLGLYDFHLSKSKSKNEYIIFLLSKMSLFSIYDMQL